MKVSRLGQASIPVLWCLFSLAGCLQEIDVPYVGDCADYPEGVYDFGDIGIGDCIAAPSDVKFYEGPEGPVLLVVNSNAYLNFSSGSLLPIPWTSLETQLDAVREGLAGYPSDEEVVPTLFYSSELRDSRLDPGDYSTLILPNFSGKLAIDPRREMAFVSNRLSLTTESATDDHIYGVDLQDPLHLTPFDLKDGETPVAADADSFLVQHDPYGMVYAANDDCSKYLYVVNETSHSVSVVDASRYPTEPLTGDKVGLVSGAIFQDVGELSFGEVTDLAVSGYVPEDRWTLSAVEGTYRAWYRGEGLDDGGSVGFADSGDGLNFSTFPSSPVLSPGTTSLDWDLDGIGRVSVVRYGDGQEYLLLYEGRRWDESVSRYRRRIGRAVVAEGDAADVVKYDVGSDSDPANDFVLGPGRDYDSWGVGSPWIFGQGSALVLWYTGEDEDGRRTLGRALSYDQGRSWEDIDQISFVIAEGSGVDPAEAGYEQMDATGFWDTSLLRYRMWFVAQKDDTSWLTYAESEDGITFTLGTLEGDTGGRLDLPGDAFVRSPSIVNEGRLLRIWYVSADEEDADTWTLHYARGFDGLLWYPAESPAQLGDGASWEGGNPSPTILKMTTGNQLRLVGESWGVAATALPLHTLVATLTATGAAEDATLQFSVIHGHVLGVGAGGEYRSDTQTFEAPAWDAYQVKAPSFDQENNLLYYAGIDMAGDSAIGAARPRDADGLAWVNADQPLEAISGTVFHPEYVTYNDTAYLYYSTTSTDGVSDIRVVTRSKDGEWTSPGGWHFPDSNAAGGVSAPSVLPPGDGDQLWHMWFTLVGSEEHQIGHAYSEDGLSWTLEAGASLVPGPGGDWDDDHVESPAVIRGNDGRYWMYYAGFNGTTYRIGLAFADPDKSGNEASRDWTWTRYEEPDTSESVPVLENESGWWDNNGVTNPSVVYDETRQRYVMWYEGILGTSHRIGRAESRDGHTWKKVYAPFTSGDAFSFTTKTLLTTEDGEESPGSIYDGAISLDVTVGGLNFTGRGATEIAMAPDCSIAVVGARYVAGAYVIDIRDDSTDMMFDANYHGIEAIVAMYTNAFAGNESDRPGGRSIVFSPSGDRFYMTSAQPDSVVVFDRNAIPDASAARLIRDGVLLGAIPLEAGYVEDKGEDTSADIGPIGLVMSEDGRYLWVANANANSVYTIDLTLGSFGEVVEVAHDVGELPVALALSPDERYLVVANYVGEMEDVGARQKAVHSTLAILDADRTSPTFGQTLAKIKNLELRDEN